MSKELVPRCDYPVGGKPCGKWASPEPTRFALDDRDILEMDLCDEHFIVLEEVYQEFSSFARKLGATGAVLKRLNEVIDAELYHTIMVGPPSKQRRMYVLHCSGEQFTTPDVRSWCVRSGLMPELGSDGKPRRALIPDEFAKEWARALTEEYRGATATMK